jgi:hypothetical protein
MDTLSSVGSGSAFIYSLFATVTAAIPSATHHNVYYETAAMILTFVSVGKYLEARAKAKTGTALEKLTSMIPAEAELVEGDIIKTVPAESLKAGDIILVREGVSIPAHNSGNYYGFTHNGWSVRLTSKSGFALDSPEVNPDDVVTEFDLSEANGNLNATESWHWNIGSTSGIVKVINEVAYN